MRREMIKPARYGDVSFDGYTDGLDEMFANIRLRQSVFSASELREIAHLLNQIAETME